MLREARVPDGCAWTLDLAAVRAEASRPAGPKPTEARTEEVTAFRFPEAVVVTGAPWAFTFMAVSVLAAGLRAF